MWHVEASIDEICQSIFTCKNFALNIIPEFQLQESEIIMDPYDLV